MIGERIDRLGGGFSIIQHPDVFCFSTDSVLLTDFAAVRRRDRICDMGCGTGGISLLIASRVNEYGPDSGISVSAVEIQPELCDMARRSVELNGAGDIVRVFEGDLRSCHEELGRESMTLCICNPPYSRQGASLAPADRQRRIARQESAVTLDEITLSAFRLLKIGGRFCAVFPAERAYEIMNSMDRARLSPKRARLVYNTVSSPPKLFLAEGVKLAGEGLIWLPPLILRREDGSATEELKRIYRDDRL